MAIPILEHLMAQRDFTLPLSRWHHVADRIRLIADSKSQEAFAALGQLRLGTAITESQKEALKARGQAALVTLGVARQAITVVGTIRHELAIANAAAGVTSLLATTESKRKERQMLAQFNAIDLVTKVGLDDVNTTLANRSTQDNSGLARRLAYGGDSESSGIAVASVPSSSLDYLRQDIDALDAEIAALTDKAADINRQPLTIALPADLAKAVGL